MSVGILEVALLMVVVFGAVCASILGRNWFYLGIIPLFAAAVMVTPADPASCLVVGVPLILIYGFTVHRLNTHAPNADN